MLATVPEVVAREILALRPALRTTTLPPELQLTGTPTELLWRNTVDDDEAVRFIRHLVLRVVQAVHPPGDSARPAKHEARGV